MPDSRNSGRDSTDQTFFQVGKKPNSTQLSVPTPSPSSAASTKAPAAGARSRAMSASVKSAMPPRIADRDQGVGHEAEGELGEDRVERVHHRVGEQPAVRVDRAGDLVRHRAVEPERDGAGGVEQDEARCRAAASCSIRLKASAISSVLPSGCSDRPEVAAGGAAVAGAHAAQHQRRDHPQPLEPRPAGPDRRRDRRGGRRDRLAGIALVLVPRAGFAFVRRQR